jgi:hypothetical protein
MKIQSLFLIIVLELFQGCLGADINDHLFGNYYLVAADDDNQLAFSYHTPEDESTYLTIIPATVFAVGYNQNYFIVKQHPYLFAKPPNKQITNYFILPIKKDFNFKTMNGLIGPLTLDEFKLKRHELEIPDSLTFSKVYENLK